MASLGLLKLHVVEAHLTRDCKPLRKMDPYAKITHRDQDWKSKTDKRGGKTPKWEHQHMDIDVKYIGDDIFIKLFDDDPGKDELISQTNAKVSTFTAEKHMDLWLQLEYKGKEAGRLRVTSEWHPNE